MSDHPELGSMLREASVNASSAMAHTLAHHINNPLQSITNSIFLALHSPDAVSRTAHLEQASDDLRQLSQLVGDLLLLHQPPSQVITSPSQGMLVPGAPSASSNPLQ